MVITSVLMVACQHFPNQLVVDCHCSFLKNDINIKSLEKPHQDFSQSQHHYFKPTHNTCDASLPLL